MLTQPVLEAFVKRDTRHIADALIGGSLLGTEIGDRVLACIDNHPERRDALVAMLSERGAW